MVPPNARQLLLALNTNATRVLDDEVLHVDDVAGCGTRCFERIEDVHVGEFDLGVEARGYFAGLGVETYLAGESDEFGGGEEGGDGDLGVGWWGGGDARGVEGVGFVGGVGRHFECVWSWCKG